LVDRLPSDESDLDVRVTVDLHVAPAVTVSTEEKRRGCLPRGIVADG